MSCVLDQTDKKILTLLQQDASVSNLELSKAIGLSPSACLTRTKSLKEEGYIKQYTAILDEARVGMQVVAFVMINLSPISRETIEAFLAKIYQLPNVLECYTLAGGNDYLLKVVAPNVQAYRDYVVDRIMSIPNVSSMETNLVITTDKRNLAIPIE